MFAAIAGLAALGAPSIAHAAEDGGTRSAFASGAGNRALAMGGAFVGVADDASAMIWNAGGLGRLERLELQATHAAYGDFGSREDYLSVVLPDWRWGAAGLAVRYYGIDGIEYRDDGNLLLGSALSNSEMEIALGFGRPVSGALSVGGAVKLQRQSLAGFSGSGLGADLGVLGRAPASLRSRAAWADRLTWGVAVRNAIQPAIRLDQESVPDPSVLRAGLAYEQPSVGGRPVLFAVDLEKSPGVGMKLHAGLDVRIHALLGIRAGMNAGRLTAGMGVAWRDFTVDYAFAGGDLANIHRVGLSRVLGRTVSQQRDAAVKAREAALQAALDEAFQKRQVEQLEDLLARARSAQAEGNHEKALELLATISILDPNHAEGRALEVISLRERAKRLAADSLRVRLAADSIALAQMRAAAVKTPAPKPTEIAQKPPAPAPRAGATTTPRGVATGPAPAPPLTPEQQRMVEQLYRSGLGAMAERRLDDALRYWELAWSMAPGYKRLAEYLKREYLIRGMDSFASGKLDQALAYWEKALQVDPNDPRAASYITRARTQQARTREIMSGSR
jgi:tetratricopeptide (TPR) repeat protein